MKSTGKAWVFALAASIATAQPALTWAGEAIAIGKPNTKVEPGKENKPEAGLFGKSVGRTGNTDPFQTVSPNLMPPAQSRNTRQDKRLQNKADEKANWLLLEEGELTEEKDTFGVNDKAFSLDGLEKKDQSRDYTFHNLTKQRPDNGNGKSNPEYARQVHKARQNLELNTSAEKSPQLSGSLHTAGELNFQKILDPGKSDKNLLAPARADLSVPGLFGSPAPAMDVKAQEKHRSKFNEFINGPSGMTANNNSLDSFRTPSLNTRPAGSSLDFTPKAPANNSLFPATAGGAGVPGFGSPAADPNFGRANPFSPSTAPAPSYREPARNHTPPPQDFPRRSF